LPDVQTDFAVYGVLGAQGAGKSTIMSHIAGNTGGQYSKSSDTTNANSFQLFPIASDEQEYLGMHQTTGVDVCITADRKIILDVQVSHLLRNL
jgi:ABC-type hemin transport system ATPase subunit